MGITSTVPTVYLRLIQGVSSQIKWIVSKETVCLVWNSNVRFLPSMWTHWVNCKTFSWESNRTWKFWFHLSSVWVNTGLCVPQFLSEYFCPIVRFSAQLCKLFLFGLIGKSALFLMPPSQVGSGYWDAKLTPNSVVGSSSARWVSRFGMR